MTDSACDEMRLRIQADLDGELTPAEAAAVSAHLEGCPDCAKMQAQLQDLSGRLRREAPFHAAPDRLRASILAQIAAVGASAGAPVAAARPRLRAPWRGWRPRLGLGQSLSFGAGFALAACLAVALVRPPRDDGLSDAVVAGHIRALQPGHLMDVVSTDQHTVKPWFDGRLDYAPPVKDLKAEGFPLAGGRLDYLAGRPVAVLIYQRRQHVIELFLWPDPHRGDGGPGEGSHSGYNFVRWDRDGLAFWAVSDISPEELADFVRRWRAA